MRMHPLVPVAKPPLYLSAIPLALTVLAAGIAQAQTGEDPGAGKQEDIYELITTAIHVRSSETALPVTVLTDDELHDAVRSTLGDTLAGQPGINNASFGPAVGQTVIRGQQGRRVMNLTNGLPNADASGNSADHAQTVEAILANAIEVLRGPSTLLYGGGAIGGVVNVVDRRIATSQLDGPAAVVEARNDTSADIKTLVGSTEFATGNLMWHFDAMQRDWNDLTIPGLAIDPRYLPEDEHEPGAETGEEAHHDEVENTQGYIANTGGRTTNLTGGASWIFDSGYLGLAVTSLDNRYGLPPGAHGVHEEDAAPGETVAAEEVPGADFVSIQMDRTRYDVQGEWRDLAPWAEKVSYRGSYTDYAHAEIEGNGDVGTRFSNESWQHRLQITHTDTPDRHGVVGLQHSNEEFSALGDESFIPITQIDTTGLFVVEDFHAMAATIEVGGRINQDQYGPQQSLAPDRDFTTYSLSGSALWDLRSEITLGLSVSRSQRAPSVEELYSNYGLGNIDDCVIHAASGSCEIGNPDFQEETSLNTDATVYLDYGKFTATITAFYNQFNDYIGQITTGVEADGYPVREYQQDNARFSGLEVDANWQLNDYLGVRVFGDNIRGKFANTGDVPRMPTSRLGAEMRLEGNEWSVYGTVIHALAQDRPGDFELVTDSWTRLDVGADYTLHAGRTGELMLFVKGRNLGDEEIRLPTSYLRGFAPEAGRSLETGVRYRF